MVLAELSWFLAAVLLAAAALLAITWFLLPYDARPRCDACGERVPHALRFCPVCGTERPREQEAHPGTQGYGFVAPARQAELSIERDPDGGTRNKRVSRKLLLFATIAMSAGVLARAAGLLGVTVDSGGSHGIEAAIMLFGGAVAFVGFVVLDAA